MIFDHMQQTRRNWRITNDAVMGGKSQGNIIVESNYLLFTGNISLENNGGFSSAFISLSPIRRGYECVTVDILGDGNTYQLKMVTNINGKQIYYFHDFITELGLRQKFTLEFFKFQASSRGRKILDAPLLKPQDIDEAGFLIKSKQAGNFSLSVFDIDFIKN